MSSRLSAVSLLALAPLLLGAGQDNNVEWNGITHIDWLERSPICPVDGETFSFTFQTYHFDLTTSAVWVREDGGAWFEVPAGFSHHRGPYDVWVATIPATGATAVVDYYLALTDGTDTDYVGPGGMSEDPPGSGWTLDMATASHAPLGATLTSDGGAVFKVWAPPPSWITDGDWFSVRGDFNDWNCGPLTNAGGDFWYGRILGDGPGLPRVVSDGDQYKYYSWDDLCGDNGWDYHEDARYRYADRSNYNNSVIVDPHAYAWSHQYFTPPPFEEMVIYELHVGTFSGLNDGLDRMGLYRDIVDHHLDHLLYIGVNAVELMPITEFDGYESWGYNPVNCWAPEESYGDQDDLKYTIDRLHHAGIAVILDVVYNHFSTGGNYVWDYGDTAYFDRTPEGEPGCDTQWGAQAAMWKQEVQDYYGDNALYWLEEYGVDGFRMDATRYMRGGEGNHGCYAEGAEILQRFTNNVNARKVNAICIAEELPNSSWIVDGTPYGGGFDAQWHDAFNDNVRAAVFAAARGQDPSMASVADAIIGGGYSCSQLVRYVECHDEAGGDGSGDDDRRLPVSLDPADPNSYKARSLTKLAQGLAIMAPGIPTFLMGGEWAEDIKFDAGWDYRIDWSKAVGRPELTLFFRDAIGLRKSECFLRADAGSYVYPANDVGEVVTFVRGDGDPLPNDVMVIANFSDTNYTDYGLSFPIDGTWYEVLNSQAGVYGGNGWGNGGSVWVSGGWANIVIPQWSLLVLRHENPRGRNPDLDTDGDVDLRDYGILQQRIGNTGCWMSADLHENGRIDQADWQVMAGSMTGPGY